MTDLCDRIAAVLLPDLEYAAAYNPTTESPEEQAGNLADAVIAELRPQLTAWAQMCVDSGDLTPAALRALHRIILGGNHE